MFQAREALFKKLLTLYVLVTSTLQKVTWLWKLHFGKIGIVILNSALITIFLSCKSVMISVTKLPLYYCSIIKIFYSNKNILLSRKTWTKNIFT